MGAASPLYLLERSDVGLVQLDRDLKVVAMNSFARRVQIPTVAANRIRRADHARRRQGDAAGIREHDAVVSAIPHRHVRAARYRADHRQARAAP